MLGMEGEGGGGGAVVSKKIFTLVIFSIQEQRFRFLHFIFCDFNFKMILHLLS